MAKKEEKAIIDSRKVIAIPRKMLDVDVKVGEYLYLLDCPKDWCLCVFFEDRKCPHLESAGLMQERTRVNALRGRHIYFTVPKELLRSDSFHFGRSITLVYKSDEKNVRIFPRPEGNKRG